MLFSSIRWMILISSRLAYIYHPSFPFFLPLRAVRSYRPHLGKKSHLKRRPSSTVSYLRVPGVFLSCEQMAGDLWRVPGIIPLSPNHQLTDVTDMALGQELAAPQHYLTAFLAAANSSMDYRWISIVQNGKNKVAY